MYQNNKLSWWLYGVGLVVVAGTHAYMLTYGLLSEQMTGHAALNLVAAFLLATGWLRRNA